jgi:hypothetical protein
VTEAEWLACDDQEAMLEALRGRGSGRKLRLFACACCRRAWRYLPNEAARRVVEANERLADGAALPGDELAEDDFAFAEFDPAGGHGDYVYSYAHGAVEQLGHREGLSAALGAAHGVSYAEATATNSFAQAPRSRTQVQSRALADLLRDICGNPFRPYSVNPVWLTPAVTALASVAYEERSLPSGELDPVRLSVLADALEEAGCSDPDLLGHLRSPGPHARGCWALDLVLGKG